MGELNFHQEDKQKKKEDKQPRTEIHPNGFYALNEGPSSMSQIWHLTSALLFKG